MVGNSVAYFLGAEGFTNTGLAPSPVVTNLGVIGCRLLQDAALVDVGGGHIQKMGPPCPTSAWRFAMAAVRPNLVLLVLSDATGQKVQLAGQFVDACSTLYQNAMLWTLVADANILRQYGATVVLVTAATVGFPFLSPQWFAANRCQNDLVRRIAASSPAIQLADLSRWMCPNDLQYCATTKFDTVIRKNVVMRPDAVHYRGVGAQVAVRWILRHHA